MPVNSGEAAGRVHGTPHLAVMSSPAASHGLLGAVRTAPDRPACGNGLSPRDGGPRTRARRRRHRQQTCRVNGAGGGQRHKDKAQEAPEDNADISNARSGRPRREWHAGPENARSARGGPGGWWKEGRGHREWGEQVGGREGEAALSPQGRPRHLPLSSLGGQPLCHGIATEPGLVPRPSRFQTLAPTGRKASRTGIFFLLLSSVNGTSSPHTHTPAGALRVPLLARSAVHAFWRPRAESKRQLTLSSGPLAPRKRR